MFYFIFLFSCVFEYSLPCFFTPVILTCLSFSLPFLLYLLLSFPSSLDAASVTGGDPETDLCSAQFCISRPRYTLHTGLCNILYRFLLYCCPLFFTKNVPISMSTVCIYATGIYWEQYAVGNLLVEASIRMLYRNFLPSFSSPFAVVLQTLFGAFCASGLSRIRATV